MPTIMAMGTNGAIQLQQNPMIIPDTVVPVRLCSGLRPDPRMSATIPSPIAHHPVKIVSIDDKNPTAPHKSVSTMMTSGGTTASPSTHGARGFGVEGCSIGDVYDPAEE